MDINLMNLEFDIVQQMCIGIGYNTLYDITLLELLRMCNSVYGFRCVIGNSVQCLLGETICNIWKTDMER